MSGAGHIGFHPRWREELVATSAEGILIFELTMGSYHVYFPDETRWRQTVPAWALDQWNRYYEACRNWCSQHRIPISLTGDALVYEEKPG